MRFTKMHGIGNDYVYVNGFEHDVADAPALARKIADRHFGVGADGLILILPPADGVDADVRMRMYNADGSEAEMCGNGVRCVAKYAHDRGLTRAKPMRVETGNGVLPIDFTTGPDGKLQTATVDMGDPVLKPDLVPLDLAHLAATEQAQTFDLTVGQTTLRGVAVSMGNPHFVIFTDTLGDEHLRLGPAIESHPAFPNRVNVHFVQVHGRDEVTVTHWERGSGATLACGTGACAVCVAGVLSSRTDRQINAHLPGGDLVLAWPQDGPVQMTGSATEVFEGEWT
jgi:diaminopimelate epimerase